MKFELPLLTFEKNALEPWISKETIEYHYGKHHKGYVDKLNTLIAGTEFENLPIDEIICRSSGALFNNAAQYWNHNFFWNCLEPHANTPQGEFHDALVRDFSSVNAFSEEFKAVGLEHFGSGYVWLVENEDTRKMSIEATSDAENPILLGKKPILTCDLWEHAYYIDYRNKREEFLNNFFKVVNWNFAERNYLSSFWKVAA